MLFVGLQASIIIDKGVGCTSLTSSMLPLNTQASGSRRDIGKPLDTASRFIQGLDRDGSGARADYYAYSSFFEVGFSPLRVIPPQLRLLPQLVWYPQPP